MENFSIKLNQNSFTDSKQLKNYKHNGAKHNHASPRPGLYPWTVPTVYVC